MIHHNNVSLRIDRYTERLAEIHIGIDLEEVRNRFKRDQRDIIHDRHILVWPRLPCGGSRRAAALGEDGKRPRKNRYYEENP